jgi:CheY-like chemotaxis protein
MPHNHSDQKAHLKLPQQQHVKKTPRRILLAEDDNDMRKLLSWSLSKYGYEVVECTNGVQMLDHLGSFFLPEEDPEIYDLIISDIRMPGVTGLEVLEGMHKYEKFPPMILITAFGDEETHAQARRLGAVAVFDKPFDIDKLIKIVLEICPPMTH